MKAAYISVNVHNVAVPLGAGSLPSGLLNGGHNSLLLGLIPDLRLFPTSPSPGNPESLEELLHSCFFRM